MIAMNTWDYRGQILGRHEVKFVQVLGGATSVVALIVPFAAYAQTATPADSAPELPATVSPEASPPQVGQDIVITGSRIVRRDYIADSPIVTAGRDLIKDSGTVSLDATLNQLPQFTASSGSQTIQTSAAASRAGRANLNLRGLGPSRTLVLLDGKRLPASDASGAVDLNLIPNSLLESVEVITGGASAAYGSDAIAGVVNLKLRSNFNGVVLDGQVGETTRGDGKNYQLSVAAGGHFADNRGRAMLAIEYYNRDLITRDSSKRPYFTEQGNTSPIIGYSGGGNLPSQAAVNAVFAKYGVSPPPARTSTFFTRDNGQLFTLAFPPSNIRGGDTIGEFVVTPNHDVDGSIDGYHLDQTKYTALQNAQERFNSFGRLEYDVGSGITVYGQALFTQYHSRVITVGRSASEGNVSASPLNPFIPADLKTLLNSRPDPTANFVISNGQFGKVTPFIDDADTTAYQLQIGVKAHDFFKDWTVDAYATRGRVRTSDSSVGSLDVALLNQVVQAPDGGRSLCEGGLDVFTMAPVSQSCKDFLMRTLSRETTLTQTVAEVTLQGGLFDLPAGDVRFALGGTYRKEQYSDQPSSEYIYATATNVRPTGAAAGQYDVKEVYGELLVPIVKDVPALKDVSLSLGYRFADYSSVGNASSYKVGLEWEVIPAIRLRGGYQRSIRAPSVGDLFAGFNTTTNPLGSPTSGGGDPCDVRQPARSGPNAAKLAALCQAQGISPELYETFQNGVTTQPVRTTGNTDLQAEKSTSYTAGVVLQPKFSSPLLSQLSLSVDYYQIKLDGAIGNLSANVILPRCYNLDGVSNPTYDPNNFYCQLTHRRAPNYNFEYLLSPTINLAGYRTWGIDAQLDWTVRLGDLGLPDSLGSVHLNTGVNYTGEYAIQNQVGEPMLDFAGTIGNNQVDEASAHPKWKAITSLSYAISKLNTTLRWRYIGPMAPSTIVTNPAASPIGIGSMSYFDLTATLGIGKQFQLRGGILNIGDRFPPKYASVAIDPYAYDLIGRRFYVGASVKF
jgi:iron complex outermembrane receptor protein